MPQDLQMQLIWPNMLRLRIRGPSKGRGTTVQNVQISKILPTTQCIVLSLSCTKQLQCLMPHADTLYPTANRCLFYVALVPVGQTQTQFFPRKSHNAWHGPGIALCGTSPCVLSANSQVMLSPIPRERRTRDEREHLSFSRKPRPHEHKTTESVLSRCRNSCTSHFSLHGEVRQS